MSDAGVIAIVTGSVTIATTIITFLTLWIKLKYGVEKVEETATKAKVVEDKIDHNTEITKQGTNQAVESAKEAVHAANNAKETVDDINRRLNGGLEKAISLLLYPIQQALMEHITQDTKDITDLKAAMKEFITDSKLKEFSDYIHQRNHDLLDAMNAQTLQTRLMLAKMEENSK